MKNHETVILASSLRKIFEIGDEKLEVLRGISFEVKRAELVTLCGPSGAGKTTLLNIISGIDKATDGEITVLGEDLGQKDEDSLGVFRCNNVGFVFQSYNLVSTLTVCENIAFPMEWLRKPTEYIKTKTQELMETVGLQNRAEHFPSQLSGGEQQRVAFARALANNPPLILADEPTGNLDTQTSRKIVEILQKSKEDGKTIVVASHDESIFQLADRRFRLEDGQLVSPSE